MTNIISSQSVQSPIGAEYDRRSAVRSFRVHMEFAQLFHAHVTVQGDSEGDAIRALSRSPHIYASHLTNQKQGIGAGPTIINRRILQIDDGTGNRMTPFKSPIRIPNPEPGLWETTAKEMEVLFRALSLLHLAEPSEESHNLLDRVKREIRYDKTGML